MKTCSHCKLAKPLDCFFRHKRTKDGLAFLCKDCHRTRYQTGQWKRSRKPDLENAQRKERYQFKTGDKIRAANRASYAKFRDKRRAAKAERYRGRFTVEMLSRTRARAIELGLEFDLRIEDLVIPDVCPVLGITLHTGSGRACDSSPSIDRKDSSRGYTRDNIRIISWRANRLKSDGTVSDFEKILLYLR